MGINSDSSIFLLKYINFNFLFTYEPKYVIIKIPQFCCYKYNLGIFRLEYSYLLFAIEVCIVKNASFIYGNTFIVNSC